MTQWITGQKYMHCAAELENYLCSKKSRESYLRPTLLLVADTTIMLSSLLPSFPFCNASCAAQNSDVLAKVLTL